MKIEINKLRWILGAIISILIPTQVALGVTPSLYSKTNVKAMNEWVESVMTGLTQRERIAQLMIPMAICDSTKNSERFVEPLVSTHKVGGLIMTRGNAAQHVAVNNYAQSLSNVPLLITIDGEWGPSMRVTDAPKFPKNMVLGAIRDDKLLYEYGQEVARECVRMGIHVNFAPVLDVNTNPLNPVIGFRSYGENPNIVAQKGIAFAKGMEDGGVMAVAKHFPGHGSTSQDSHKTLPMVDKSYTELQLVDLLPFRQYIKAGLSGVLSAHLWVPAIDTTNIPSSMSVEVVKNLLNSTMGFKGLIFTDGLEMKGARTKGSVCVDALLAGNDVLLGVKDVRSEIIAIENAIENKIISASLIDEKCRKILRYKYVLGAHIPKYISADNVEAEINSPYAQALVNRLWGAAITVVKNSNSLLPIKNLEKQEIAYISLGKGSDSEFRRTCALYADIHNIDPENLTKDKMSQYSTIIVGVYSDNEVAKTLLKRITDNSQNVIPVYFISPYKISAFKESLTTGNVSPIVAYDNNQMAESNAAQAIFGGIGVSGRLPVTIPEVAKCGMGIDYKAVRLGYGLPDEVGVDNALLSFVDSIAGEGLKTGAFPGCQVLVAKSGKIICNRAYGFISSEKLVRVTPETIYDLASVSKATGTLAGIMKAVDDKLIDVKSPASRYIPQLRNTPKKDITIRDLLFHETGIAPSLNMYNVMLDSTTFCAPLFKQKKDYTYSIKVASNTFGNRNARLRTDILSRNKSQKFNINICNGIYGSKATYDSIMSRIYNIQLRADKDYRYSCLNFCLLMNAEENMTHIPHDKYVHDNIFAPLGSYHAVYRPLEHFNRTQIAKTESDNMLRKQMMWGYVHDELACFSGGVQGNAGVFSNANDIAKLCQMWLNDGMYGGSRILSAKTVKQFITEKSPNSRRGLGFDKPDKTNDDNSPTCSEATASTFGHLGFTGTCFWVDPENEIIYIFLSNCVNPTRNNKAFSNLDIRPRILSKVYQSLKK